MRPHPRRARTDATAPEAWATSDRSGFVGNQKDLRWQVQWAGTQLINTRVLVYEDEYDEPQRQLGTIILPPDPVSIPNARIEVYPIDELWEIMCESATNSGGNNALPLYLEATTMAAAQPEPGTAQPTKSLSLELSTIQMGNAATS
jgi:hypothetical protein